MDFTRNKTDVSFTDLEFWQCSEFISIVDQTDCKYENPISNKWLIIKGTEDQITRFVDLYQKRYFK